MMIGSFIGQYRVDGKLGAGGMGEVYLALDTMLEREVALKVLHRFATEDAGWLERFRSEAVTLARLNHPNIAILHNFFEAGQDYYMVMEYVEGETFEQLLGREETLPLPVALEWFCQTLRGFEHAHARNVIHRDIKPANLMLNGEGVVKITDFGIARVMGGQRLTKTGKVIGTLEYMSPEQVRGEEQDVRSDIYSLGILLHELTTQYVPFSSTSDYEIMRSHLELDPRPPRELNGDLPADIEAAILKALAKKSEDRFQTAVQFRAAIEPSLAQLSGGRPAVPFPLTRQRTREATRKTPAIPSVAQPETVVAQSETAVAPQIKAPVNTETTVANQIAPPVPKTPAAKPAPSTPKAPKAPMQWPPPWLSPQVALGAALAFLVAMLLLVMLSRGGSGTKNSTVVISTPTPVTEAVTAEPTNTPLTNGDEKNDDEETPGYNEEIPTTRPPIAIITPLPTEKPTPRPTAKPTPRPTARPIARPRPRPTVRRSRPTVKRSTPRRTTPRRSTPRKSRPSGGGGGGGPDVGSIIRNS